MQGFFLESMPEEPTNAEPEKQAPTFEGDVYSRNLWVVDFLKWNGDDAQKSKQVLRKKGQATKTKGDAGCEAPFAEMLDDEALMDALLKKRVEVDSTADADWAPDFAVGARGGQWLFANKGGWGSTTSGRRLRRSWRANGAWKLGSTVSLRLRSELTVAMPLSHFVRRGLRACSFSSTWGCRRAAALCTTTRSYQTSRKTRRSSAFFCLGTAGFASESRRFAP